MFFVTDLSIETSRAAELFRTFSVILDNHQEDKHFEMLWQDFVGNLNREYYNIRMVVYWRVRT